MTTRNRSPRNSDGLTARERKFVILYVALGNGAEAMRQAGYAEKTALSGSEHLLRRPAVVGAISKAEAAVMRKLQIDVDRTRQEMARIAFLDPRELYREDGTMKPPKEWPAHVAAAISSIKYHEVPLVTADGVSVRGCTAEVRFVPKNPAIEMLGRHLEMFVDRFAMEDRRTPEQEERRQKVREQFIDLLEDLAARGAAPAPARTGVLQHAAQPGMRPEERPL